MKIDFHYACIKVLAQVAGFKPDEAQIIAYASQFVDDATLHKPLRIEGIPLKVKGLLRFDHEGRMEPACSAHSGIGLIHLLKCDVQKKVLLPFHFIPSDPSQDRWTTSRGCPMARALVEQALEALKDPQGERQRNLIRLGIALHSFADTYSHEGFSGQNRMENDCSLIETWEGEGWKGIEESKAWLLAMVPPIGHETVDTFPDEGWRTWRFRKEDDAQVTVANGDKFLAAAEAIFGLLAGSPEKGQSFKEIRESIRGCLAAPFSNKAGALRVWKNRFPGIAFEYDPKAWWDEALSGGVLDFLCLDELFGVEQQAKGDLKWFYFHIEALAQRQYVLSKVAKHSSRVAEVAVARKAIVLVHGICRFDLAWYKAQLDAISYFKNIPSLLEEAGFTVYLADLPWAQGVDVRSAELRRQLAVFAGDWKAGGGNGKLHIFAHSMGGLDTRHMIFDGLKKGDAFGRDALASLTTIGTPHKGSSFADAGGPMRVLIEVFLRHLGVSDGSLAGLADLRCSACRVWNEKAKEEENRYFRGPREPMDPNRILVRTFAGAQAGSFIFTPLKPSYFLIKQVEGENDGLVSVDSAKWEDRYFAGLINADHLNEIGWADDQEKEEPPRQLERRIQKFYLEIARKLPPG